MKRCEPVRLIAIACEYCVENFSMLCDRPSYSVGIRERALSVRLDISVKLGEYLAKQTVSRRTVDDAVECRIKLLKMLGILLLYIEFRKLHRVGKPCRILTADPLRRLLWGSDGKPVLTVR